MPNLKFSIITASYNQRAYLHRCLQSVQVQTYRNFEHLIQDGLSTDGSQDILRTYALENENVRLTIERDGGQVQAINNGLHHGTGDVMVWLNTDDYFFEESTLQTVASIFNDPNIDVVYGKGCYVDEQGMRLRDVYVKPAIQSPLDLLGSIGIFQPALYFRRSVFDRLGGLDPRYQLTLDYEYWIRLLQAGVRFRFVDAYLANATLHSESKTCGSRTAQLIESMLLLKQKFSYVHPDWVDRLYQHIVADDDWTVNAKRKGDRHTDMRSYKAGGGHFGTELTAEIPVRVATTSRAIALGQNHEALKRVVVTSFDDNYFVQGLNLIASLHAFCRDSIDLIVVFDLGLSSQHRKFIEGLSGVVCRDYPSAEPWSGYYHPKSYMYKCFAIFEARHLVDPADGVVLWIDAGVCVTAPMEEVFRLIEVRGAFLINHDDRLSNSMVNAAFTHPKQVEKLELNFDELEAEHVCSCVVGYRRGSTGEELMEKVHALSLEMDLSAYTKHPAPKWQRAVFVESELVAIAETLNSNIQAGAEITLAPLARFPYYGHRQDQSLFSNIAARMGLEAFSATRYCPATDYSSKISFENWNSGGEFKGIARTGELPEGHTAPMFHHRGTYSNLTGLLLERNAFISTEVAFILGNGPSLKQLPFTTFRNIATIGMNAAYRYWDEQGWYPSYYCCMDTVVIMSHAAEIHRLITKAEIYGIRLFFLRRIILERYPDLESNPRVLFLEDLRPLTPLFQVEPVTTGSYSLLFMVFIGFRTLFLSGVDCNYVERVAGVVDGGQQNKLIVVDEITSNPNYFFESYQQPGDEFNVPNPSKDLHVRSWRNSAETIRNQQQRLGAVRVVNLNEASRVDCFENGRWESAIDAVSKKVGNIARDLSRTFLPHPSSSRALTNEIQLAVQRAVVRRERNSVGFLQPTYIRKDLVVARKTAGRRVEFTLEGGPRLLADDVLTAVVLIRMKKPRPFRFSLLDLSSWRLRPTVTVTGWQQDQPTFEGQAGQYLTALGENRILGLINNTASREVTFEGISIEMDDTDLSIDALEIQFVEVSHFRPVGAVASTTHFAPSVGGEREVPTTKPYDKDFSPSFARALALFRQRDFDAALSMSQRLHQLQPEFKWYGELAKACELKRDQR
jgi:glycosyltransferase involved in cell wall biosynthesis